MPNKPHVGTWSKEFLDALDALDSARSASQADGTSRDCSHEYELAAAAQAVADARAQLDEFGPGRTAAQKKADKLAAKEAEAEKRRDRKKHIY